MLIYGFGVQAGHHSLMGTTKDPADGKAVAGSVFAAVVVYAVCDSILVCSVWAPSRRRRRRRDWEIGRWRWVEK